MQFQNVLFDLDGTLTDPKMGITQGVQYALSRFDIVENNLDTLEPFIGPPLSFSFAEFYGFSELDCMKAIGYYREYYGDQGMFENVVYPGIPELLQMLVNQQRTLFVATSKPTEYAEKIIQHFGLDRYFQQVYGSNLDDTGSDKSEIISNVIHKSSLEKTNVMMIGDRKYDIIGANNNGVVSIAVEYGYGSREELLDCKPTYIVETVEKLKGLFSEEGKGK
ncbi:HAD hydrolase-like protein [Paenibacillus crassostreae]|uniref:Phosphoglycolate phosphatase n=1 Tax=Paenibacillus crassostreae TaxID=1763538 RepID=A0A167FRM6_9BACL|nr:HAD hydrolase-like protein [Paenibacillus crassostreae]AOZ94131.1 phosphoglycolate phosphatase [Paenibacillus crassostreae]OAB76833.1 phosphoglycolate phosphatase [Paenibacillus crassostreae]